MTRGCLFLLPRSSPYIQPFCAVGQSQCLYGAYFPVAALPGISEVACMGRPRGPNRCWDLSFSQRAPEVPLMTWIHTAAREGAMLKAHWENKTQESMENFVKRFIRRGGPGGSARTFPTGACGYYADWMQGLCPIITGILVLILICLF